MQLETFFPYRLAITAEAFSRHLVAVYGHAYGLSREEWRLLFLIDGADEITSLDLARRSTLDKVQISRASQKLEERGLISRAVAGADRRLRLFSITAEGKQTFSRAFAEVEARAAEILARLDDEDSAALERGLLALRQACDET